jgi:hypothetical protein
MLYGSLGLKPRILLLNGIHSTGEESVDRIGDLLRSLGYEVIDVPLKKVKLFTGRSESLIEENLDIIRWYAREGDHFVCHSNGCRLNYRLLKMGFCAGELFWFAPALDSDIDLPEDNFANLALFTNRYDKVLLFGSLIFRHEWGALGRVGYKGKPTRKVVQVPCNKQGVLAHGHYFREPFLSDIFPVITQRIGPPENKCK